MLQGNKRDVLSPSKIREFPKWKYTDEARMGTILHSAKEGKKFLPDPAPGSEFNQAYTILRGGLV